ncbi:MAG TPA: DUF2339 domain-containing protein [Allosphingosinicella sp.]|jgi:uncharacterized membrane protein|nr:DUF2339 domain-containing protein [Allosphingosinicella sp.]
MEFLIPILLLAVLLLFLANQSLRTRLIRLELRLDALEDGAPSPVPPPLHSPAKTEPAPARPQPVAFEWTPEPAPAVEEGAPAPAETLGGLFERLVAGRLLIWLGGIALVLAAVFLIRYSIDIGLMTPAARMVAAGLFGLVLIGAGEYARGGRLADDPRIAQALAGAGIAVLYATFYGSYRLHALIDSQVASAAMLIVTGTALGLSLRHGAATAVMGLVGGFLTPLLVGDPEAGALPLLAYLALLDIALFLLAWRRGWTWLAAAAAVLSFLWTGFLIAQPGGRDALYAGGFVAMLALAAALVRPGAGRQLVLIQPLAIGIVQLALLVARTDLGAPAWGLFAGLSAASLALAAMRRDCLAAPPLALAFALVLLGAKAATGQDEWVPAAAMGITALFGAGGLALAWRKRETLWTGLASAGFAGPLLIARTLRPELLDRPAWGALAALLALGPVFLVWASRTRASDKAPADLALLIAGAAAAALAGAAIWDLAAPDWVAAGWLAVALGAALAARRFGDLALGTVAMLAGIVAVLRSLWMAPSLSATATESLLGFPALAAYLPNSTTALTTFAVPAILLIAIRFVLPPLPLGARRGLPLVAGLFALAALYIWFKQAFGLAGQEDFVARGLIERTIITQALFAAGWLLAAGIVKPPRIEPDLARLGGTMLTIVAAARLVWFDMVLHNPLWADQWVGTVPVLNLILPAFLLSAAWLYAARRRAAAATRSGLWLAAFLLALIAGIALLVRQAFHGPILTGGADMPTAEAYGYSLAGLVVAIALILAGIRLPDKALRLAGLVLLTATIVKVFLIDASDLEGVLRILSFLVLGIALIGIGRLYGPVLRAEREQA